MILARFLLRSGAAPRRSLQWSVTYRIGVHSIPDSLSAPAQKPYHMRILFTRKNGDFGAISATERSCVAPISKVESHISDRCSSLPDSLFAPAQKPYRVGILFTHKNGNFGAISVTKRSCAALISKVKRHISDRGRSEDWDLVHTEFVQIFGSKIQDFLPTFFHNNNFFFETQG